MAVSIVRNGVTVTVKDVSTSQYKAHSIEIKTDSGDSEVDRVVSYYHLYCQAIHHFINGKHETAFILLNNWMDAHRALSKEQQKKAATYYPNFWDETLTQLIF